MFVPKENTQLTVELPGERLRANVYKVVDQNTVIVEMTDVPMAKTHNYKKGDLIACRRSQGVFDVQWKPVEEVRRVPDVHPEPKAPPKKAAKKATKKGAKTAAKKPTPKKPVKKPAKKAKR